MNLSAAEDVQIWVYSFRNSYVLGPNVGLGWSS